MNTLKLGSRGADVVALQKRLSIMADGIFGPLTREAVVEFQRSNSLTPDGIAGQHTLTAMGLTSSSKSTGTQTRLVDQIIIHCTATPEGEDFSVEQVRSWHLARGFSDIGYHFLVALDGTVRRGRPEAIAGAHCTGHNTRSIGVCYVGGCPVRSVKNWASNAVDTRTPAQRHALLELVRELKRRYPGATVHGHREFATKPCPGFDAQSEYRHV